MTYGSVKIAPGGEFDPGGISPHQTRPPADNFPTQAQEARSVGWIWRVRLLKKTHRELRPSPRMGTKKRALQMKPHFPQAPAPAVLI